MEDGRLNFEIRHRILVSSCQALVFESREDNEIEDFLGGYLFIYFSKAGKISVVYMHGNEGGEIDTCHVILVKERFPMETARII